MLFTVVFVDLVSELFRRLVFACYDIDVSIMA